jgi:hypothetical protein
MNVMEEGLLTLSGAWDATLLAPITEINHDLLAALRASALCDAKPRRPRLLAELREEWSRLDPTALEALARCPYLLLDVFTAGRRWEAFVGSVMDETAPSGYFTAAEGITLLRRTLLLGWHMARANRLGARLLLGMSATCAERLGNTRLQDLESLAEHGASGLAPRWEQQPRVWQQLLRAGAQGQALQLRAVQLRGWQLMAAAWTP